MKYFSYQTATDEPHQEHAAASAQQAAKAGQGDGEGSGAVQGLRSQRSLEEDQDHAQVSLIKSL